MNNPINFRLNAVLELFIRYSAIFRHAWLEQKKLDLRPRLPHEVQFLPAALELQETPVSPAPRVTMWLLMTFSFIALLWALFGHIDVVAIAHGKIVPSDRTKVIQSFETATVRAIKVIDGQTIKAGEVLVELDATDTSADTKRIANDHITALLKAERAKALLDAIDSNKLAIIANVPEVDKFRLEQEQRILDGEYGEHLAKLARLDAEISQRRAGLNSTREIVHKLELTVPIARQRADDIEGMVKKNFISRHDYLEKEQARIEQEADLATQRSRVQELTASLQEAQSQRAEIIAAAKRLALDNLYEAEQKSITYQQELIKAQSRNRHMTITSPVDGTVQQLGVHTVGGVVTEAQQLMLIVPKDNPIEVEAYVENKDIGFVNPGQEAVVKVETFSFTKYGTIDATIISVSNDAVNDEKQGLIFPIQVKLAKPTILVESKEVRLSPGMAVSVEVKTAQRRVIEYFLAPLLQHKDESLRER